MSTNQTYIKKKKSNPLRYFATHESLTEEACWSECWWFSSILLFFFCSASVKRTEMTITGDDLKTHEVI